MNLFNRYLTGTKFIFQGTKDVFTIPHLLPWAVIPFIIDVFILFFFFFWGKQKISFFKSQIMDFIFSETNTWLYTLLSPIIGLLIWVAFIIILLYGTFLLAMIVAVPFHTIIAEKILCHYGKLQSPPFSWGRWIQVNVRMFIISLIKSALFAIIGLFLFILSFIPVLNLVSSFTAFLIMAYDCADYGLEVKEMTLLQRFEYFKNHFPEFLGMATTLTASVFLPGSTLLLLPIAVAGSSWVICQSPEVQFDPNTGT